VLGVIALALAALAIGCSTVSPSQYVSPKITGQVLDAETRQPIKGAQIRPANSDGRVRPDAISSGGHLLETAAAVRSDREGRFTMPSVRVLGPLGSTGWYSVTLAFERSGYESLVKTFSLKDSTNTASGEPWIDAGQVSLPRLTR
jgi:hypothetical protein